MAFKFSLQKVLEHRKVIEDIAQRDMQDAMFLLVQEKEKLKSMELLKSQARDHSFKTERSGGQLAEGLKEAQEFVVRQTQVMELQQAKIREAENLVEDRREILRQAAIDYKIIDKLREKKLTAAKQREAMEQLKLLDDQTIMRNRFKGSI